jgi:hypothetical protein
VAEVRAAAGADLDHPAAQAGKQLAAVLGAAATFADLGDSRVDASKHRMGGALCHHAPVRDSSPLARRCLASARIAARSNVSQVHWVERAVPRGL